MIDTNILLDTLALWEHFFEWAATVLRYVAEEKGTGGMSANTVRVSYYYILRKHLQADAARTAMRGLMELRDVVSMTEAECMMALDLLMDYYEDAFLACCAAQWKADCIVTRNEKHFEPSPVKALSPEEFLKDYLSLEDTPI